MLSACIINEKMAHNQTLSQLLHTNCPQVTVVGTATDVESGFTLINRLAPLLVFLDGAMDGATGFDIIPRFNLIPFEVIMTTARDQYPDRSFGENAVACLPEPIGIGDLKEAVTRAEQQLELKQSYYATFRHLRQLIGIAPSKISIPVLDGYIFVNSEDIIRCEGAGSYSWFHMVNGKKIMASLRLKECEDLFPDYTFFRPHKSHIINIKHIARYTRGRGGHIEMVDGSSVDVAPHKKDPFLKLVRTSRTF